jgi:hypothetical protein
MLLTLLLFSSLVQPLEALTLPENFTLQRKIVAVHHQDPESGNFADHLTVWIYAEKGKFEPLVIIEAKTSVGRLWISNYSREELGRALPDVRHRPNWKITHFDVGTMSFTFTNPDDNEVARATFVLSLLGPNRLNLFRKQLGELDYDDFLISEDSADNSQCNKYLH